MASGWSIPAAILGAGGLIGLGLYFGLRTSGPARPRPDPEPPRVHPVASEQPPALSETPAPDPKDIVRTRAKAALEELRDALVETCWEPSAAKDPEPAAISVGLSLAFDARGKVRGTGVIERREASRPDISPCLADAVHAISIEGVGQPVSVELELTLPEA